MKKIISVFLCLAAVLFTFTCCGNDKGGTTAPLITESTETTENSTSSTEAPSATELSPQINASTVVDDENTDISYPIDRSNTVLTGDKGGKTLTGYTPLPAITYNATQNKGNFSTQKKSHSHGPASGGKAHHTVVQFQKEFERFSAFTLGDQNKKELYLTFDCGYEHDNLTEKVLDVLKEKNVPATFFSTLDHVKAEPELIGRMIREGHIVGNHSATHPSFATIDREKMAKEIETFENHMREKFGYASKFFRFPSGEYTDSALDQIASLGYVSVFWSVAYNDWNTDKIQGKDYAVETVMSRLHNGAIILLHSVSHDNAEALPDIIDKARAEGYQFKSLTDII
ncbi:MAG: polysaccharide deacetylase family protein [Acutalibacteraceae bacterium]|nr:polysaccharide deacetylase family protein [Acutalibacteraceae bacterium]